MAFPLISLLIGYVSDKYDTILPIMIAMIIALAINYTIGTLWYSFIAGVGFMEGFMVCVVPFILVDLIKVALATTIGINVKKRIKREVFSC